MKKIITWFMVVRHRLFGPFYHRHRLGTPYGVPMEEPHTCCLVCGSEYPVSRVPKFSARDV